MGTRSEIQKSGISQTGRRFSDDPGNRPHLKGDLAEMVAKIQKLELEVEQEKGRFSLFGLVLRAGSEQRWDLVAAADWVGSSRQAALRYLSERVSHVLNSDELLKISRIVPMDARDDFVEEMHKLIVVKHGLREVDDNDVAGVEVERALIITSANSGNSRVGQ